MQDVTNPSINQCNNTVCNNNGQCIMKEGGGYDCNCWSGYTGMLCETGIIIYS